MKRLYLVRRVMPSGAVSWLYDWAFSTSGSGAVWTHERDKAKRLDAFDSALAVSAARAEGYQVDRVKENVT